MNKETPGGQDKTKILFVCTGNACRSQIAEGWAKHLKSDVLDVYSAGICPSAVNQIAIEIMKEAGLDISQQWSKHIDEVAHIDFDYVVTLCDNAREYCPVFPSNAKRIHRSFEDPSFMLGTQQEVLAAFRELRAQIKAFIETIPESLENAPTY